ASARGGRDSMGMVLHDTPPRARLILLLAAIAICMSCSMGSGEDALGTAESAARAQEPRPYAALAVGASHACGLLGDGTVECWGYNYYGQLGDGTNTNRSTPVAVSWLSHVLQIVAGTYHTCALIDDGTVKCWGSNSAGQLGDGTLSSHNTPGVVTGIG